MRVVEKEHITGFSSTMWFIDSRRSNTCIAQDRRKVLRKGYLLVTKISTKTVVPSLCFVERN